MGDTSKFLSQNVEFQQDMRLALGSVADLCYHIASESGWHNNDDRQPGTFMMLMVSEIAEAMEGNRKDKMDDHLPHRKQEEVELADAIIRILDYAKFKELDVEGALVEKLIYNTQRADHKPENRAKEGGKKY